MLDFFKLTPEEFETLCYQYICTIYQKPGYEVKHTRYVHDGGRDIEITFYDELSHFKIWAECKRHRNNIGLDDIGKNVVLVLSKHVNRVIFFSASEITEGAKIEITRIAYAFNFDVSFLCGERLSEELQTQAELIAKFFGDKAISYASSSNEDLAVCCSVSEFESDVILPLVKGQKRIVLRKGGFFNIYIHLSNRMSNLIQDLRVETCSCPSSVRMMDSIVRYEHLMRQSDVIAQFRGEIINRHSAIIEPPKITITYNCAGELKSKLITLPDLDLSKCKQYPFVGKRVTEFLANKVNNALEWCSRAYPQIFNLHGVSGSGKSRLSLEIQHMASRKGYRTIYLNGSDYIEFDLLRKLICELLHLPFYHGNINFLPEDIIELIKSQGGSETFAKSISGFLAHGKFKDGNTYYLIEAFAHFILNPYRENGYCITVDNTQVLHPQILKFLTRLIDIFTQNHGQVILILVSNTERKPSFPKNFQDFFTYLSEKANERCTSLIVYECMPFSETDAKLLLMDMFKIKEQNDMFLKKLLRWTGRLPLEIIMTLEYLCEMKIIEWIDSSTWRICNQEYITQFLSRAFPPSCSILTRRVESWRNTHNKSDNEKFTEILSTVICFEGLLPYIYISECKIDQELIGKMIDSLWLVPDSSGQGITFYHDSIWDYFNIQPFYKSNAIVLKKVLNWMENNKLADISHRQKIKFLCYYYLNQFEDAKNCGLSLLSDSSDQPHADIAEVSQILYDDPRMKKNPVELLLVAEIYANAIFEFDNKDLGCEIYETIVDYIKTQCESLELEHICKILHRAINSQLQSARYDTALDWIKMLNNIPDISIEYRFIVENRYGVTYIALGKFKSAKDHLELCLLLAEEQMHNLFWSSTAHSDLALFYFYNWKQYGKENARQHIIDEFEMAILDYTQFGVTNISRDIEMAWHHVFVDILNGNFKAGIDKASNCIELSYQNNQTYGLARAYNLKALAQLQAGEIDMAKNSLNESLHICELCSFPSGIFRMYNNLGVIAYVIKDFLQAKYYFKTALESLDWHQIEYKQIPVLSNLLAVSLRCEDSNLFEMISRISDESASNELLEFRKRLSLDAIEKNKLESLSYWGFSEISYIF